MKGKTMQYNLVKHSGAYFVDNLKEHYSEHNNTMLLVRYPEGDCDTVSHCNEKMHSALYDLYQTSDVLKDGDTFAINGRVVFRCYGVHVIEA
jgi:hypothetical protein